MGLFKKTTTPKPLSDAEFKRSLAAIKARGEAERKEIRKAIEKRGRAWSPLSTGANLDD